MTAYYKRKLIQLNLISFLLTLDSKPRSFSSKLFYKHLKTSRSRVYSMKTRIWSRQNQFLFLKISKISLDLMSPSTKFSPSSIRAVKFLVRERKSKTTRSLQHSISCWYCSQMSWNRFVISSPLTWFLSAQLLTSFLGKATTFRWTEFTNQRSCIEYLLISAMIFKCNYTISIWSLCDNIKIVKQECSLTTQWSRFNAQFRGAASKQKSSFSVRRESSVSSKKY